MKSTKLINNSSSNRDYKLFERLVSIICRFCIDYQREFDELCHEMFHPVHINSYLYTCLVCIIYHGRL